MSAAQAPADLPFWAAWGRLLLAPLESAAQLPAAVWAMAALAVMLSHALRASRLAAEWGPRIGLRWGMALRLGLLHNAAVCLLPFRSGELGYAWWLHQGWGVPLRQSAPSLLWLRLQDLIVLALLTTACLLPDALPDPLPAPLRVPLAGLAVAGLAALLVWRLQRPIPQRHPDSGDPAPLRWARAPTFVHPLQRALQAGLRSTGGWRAWSFAALNWAIRLAVQGGLLALLLGLPLSAALRGAAGGEWGGLLPLQLPAGIGPQQGGVWLALQSAPVELPAALTVLGAALCVHLFWVGVGLAGAAAAALWPGERPWHRPPSTACPASLPQAEGLS